MSGGASANWIAPAPGVSLRRQAGGDARAAALRRHIGEINTVRKHLSRIKGGRLARTRIRRELVTIAISDVPGDDPAVIGSGPTVPDPTTLADARAIVARYRLDLPAGVTARARRSRQRNARSPAMRSSPAARSRWSRGRPMRSRSAEAAVRAAGYDCVSARRPRSKAKRARSPPTHARLARELRARRPPRRDPLGRRTDRHDPRPRAAAGRTRNTRWRWRSRSTARRRSRRSPATPTAPTAAAASPTIPAGAFVDGDDAWRARGRSASIRPLSCRQQFDRILRQLLATCCDRADLHQRQRLPGHPR